MRKTILSAVFLAAAGLSSLAAQGFTPTYPSSSDGRSPTSLATQDLFTAAPDQYMDVLLWSDLADPVFLFKFQPSTIGGGSTTSDMEAGLGAAFFPGLYTGIHLRYNAYQRPIPGNGLSLSQTQNNTVLLDANGNSLGVSSVESTAVAFQDNRTVVPTFLAGFKLGDLALGIRSLTNLSHTINTGTYSAAGAISSSSLTRVKDTSGNLVSLSGTNYDPEGYDKFSNIYQQLEAGAALPLGGLKVLAKAALEFGLVDFSDARFQETVTALGSNGLPSFAGTKSKLGSNPGVSSWNSTEYAEKGAYAVLSTPLGAKVEVPFSLFGAKATGSAGLDYAPTLVFYDNTLPGLNGGETKVAGTGNTTTTRSYTATLDPATQFIATTQTTRYTVDHSAYTSYLLQRASLPAQLVVEPSSAVRFGFRLTPQVNLQNQSYTRTRGYRETTVYDDGDGVAASSDANDYTSVTDFKQKTLEYSYTYNTFGMSFDAGVQLEVIKNFLTVNFGSQMNLGSLAQFSSDSKNTGAESTVTSTTRAGTTEVTTSNITTNPVTNDMEKYVSDSGSQSTLRSTLGLTVQVNPNVTLDLLMATRDALNLLSTQAYGSGSGFFDLNNYSLQLTIKLPPVSAERSAE